MDRLSRNGFIFSWTIEKFRFVDTRKRLESPVFVVDIFRETKWCLAIDHDLKESDKAVGVFLVRYVDDYPSSIFLNYDITIISGGTVIKNSAKNQEFKNSAEPVGFGFSKIINLNELFPEQKLLTSGDDLSIECKMWMLENESSRIVQLTHFLKSVENKISSLYEFPSENFNNLKDIEKIRGKMVQMNNLCRARTIIDVEETEFFWAVKQFSDLQKNEKKILFAKSSLSAESCAAITLHLTDDDMIQIDVLVNKNLSDKCVSVHCQVGVCDVYGAIRIQSTKMCYFAQGIRQRLSKCCLGPAVRRSLSFENVVRKSDILSAKERFLEKDLLNLHFVLTFVSESSFSRITYSTSNKYNVLTTDPIDDPLSRQMENLFVSSKHSDVILKAQDQEIQAHKVVLCSMSPVLEAMFDADMEERNTGVVHVTDVDADTMKTLLRYMYTGEIDEMDVEECLDLFAASDKYQVWSLTRECRKRLRSNMSAENVCDILMRPHTHSDDVLKTQAMEFVCRNASAVFASEEWRSTAKKNPELATEVILFVTTGLQKK